MVLCILSSTSFHFLVQLFVGFRNHRTIHAENVIIINILKRTTMVLAISPPSLLGGVGKVKEYGTNKKTLRIDA